MSTIFQKIIDGEIPCYRIAENDRFLAFLDVRPLTKGHTLVIPKQAVDYIFDMEDAQLSEMNLFAKKVAKGIKKIVPCLKIGVAVIGLEVPHAHIHLVPMNKISDLNFSGDRVTFSDAEYQQIASEINQVITQD